MTVNQIIERYPYYKAVSENEVELVDKDFIQEVFSQSIQTKYARITPKNIVTGEDAELIGKITQGSVNVDGKSAVRRSCNLTLTTTNVKGTINNSIWALKTKFQLDVGIQSPRNWVNEKGLGYKAGDIVWFAMGEFAVQSFNASLSVNSYTITISGQDKMTLLNGTLGGTFPVQVNLSQYEQLNEKGEVVSIHQVPLDEIIINMLLTYGGENFEDIIINGLSEEKASNLLEYRGSTPLYVLMGPKSDREEDQGKIVPKTITTYGNQKVYVNDSPIAIKDLQNYYVNSDTIGSSFVLSEKGAKSYYCRKVEYGETAGYEPTELIYPGELIGDVGTTVTNTLDKIKGVYSTYEYFYDQFGRFIWQKRPNAYKISYPEMNKEGRLKIELTETLEPFWTFENLEVQTSLGNNSVIQDVKNDFTVWGKKKSTAGELPIHMRVAIQKKPTYYKASDDTEYTTADYDWREIIYQMAKDYNNNRDKSVQDWRNTIAERNSGFYPDGITGYEDYYLDMLTFWRQLYDPDRPVQYEPTTGDDESHDTLYLPYKYEEIDLDEADSLNVSSWYCHEVGKDGKSHNYYKWVDSLDVERYFETNSSSVGGTSASVYGYVKGEVIDLGKAADLSKGGIYYWQREKNGSRKWQGTPFSLFEYHKTERPTSLGSINVRPSECINNCYYAHKSNLDVKKPIITSSEIQYIEGEKKYFNASGTYNVGDINGRYEFGEDVQYSQNIKDAGENSESIIQKNGCTWTVWFKDEGIQVTQYRRAIAVKIGSTIYNQNKDCATVVAALKAALAKKRTDIYMYGHWIDKDNNNAEYILRFQPLTSKAHVKAYYYTETQTEDHVQYYKNHKGEFSFLADHPAGKRPRHQWHFRTTTTTVRDTQSGDKNGEEIRENDSRIITTTTVANGKTTIEKKVYTPVVSYLNAPKDSIYYKDSNGDLKLIDYKEAYSQSMNLSKVIRKIEEGNMEEVLAGTEGIWVSDGNLPIKKNIYKFDWTGYKTDTTQSGIVYYYKTSDFNLDGANDYWNKRLLLEEPYNRLFWIDFIDPDEGQEVGKSAPWYAQYAKEKIGKRPKAANDSAVTAINYNNTPEIEFNTKTFPLSDNFRKYFVVSAQGKTAQEAIDDWLSKYTFCSETVTTNIIPVYILEPNQIIEIKDPNISGIESNYSINSMSIPLGYNGTMSLNLTKIFEYDK